MNARGNCVSISVCLRIEFFQKSWYDIDKLFNCNHKKFVKKAFENVRRALCE